MNILRNKPAGMLEAEWVARHVEFREPNVFHAGYLAELKAIMIEVAAWRLKHPEARMRLRDWLRNTGYRDWRGRGVSTKGWTNLSKI